MKPFLAILATRIDFYRDAAHRCRVCLERLPTDMQRMVNLHNTTNFQVRKFWRLKDMQRCNNATERAYRGAIQQHFSGTQETILEGRK